MILTEQNYFSTEASRAYMSVSQFKSFAKCQATALAEINGEYEREKTTALLVGSYIDAYFDGTLAGFILQKPNVFTKDNKLKQPYQHAHTIINRIEKDKLFMEYMSGKKQVIMTGYICGVSIKIKIDSLHPDKIVDLKIVKDFANIKDDERGFLPWYEYWGYDLQGAVYQEIVRQNTGKVLPFYLSAATKEKTTDIDIIHLPQKMLHFALDRFKNDVVMYDAIKKGIIAPARCEMCEYCKISKVLTAPTEADEYYLI